MSYTGQVKEGVVVFDGTGSSAGGCAGLHCGGVRGQARAAKLGRGLQRADRRRRRVARGFGREPRPLHPRDFQAMRECLAD